MADQLRVSGQKQLIRALKRAGNEDLLAALKEANAAAAKEVEDEARPNIPHRTGKLAASLRSSGTQKAGVVRIGKASIPYAGPIHFGWPNRPNREKGWRGGPIAPNPFLYEAIDKRAQKVVEIYYERIQKICDMVENST